MATPVKLCCCVKSVIAHGERAYVLELTPENHPVPRFKPGHFFTLH
ncbi:MAG: hypothetical protein MUO97_02405 [Dehalococcoidia bacterium]|nr:hypothetical protein [Dehalococcoidia bacterium]